MKNSDITHPLFQEAVAAMDAGDLPALRKFLKNNPQLVRERLDCPTEGYFKYPYLLWFVADNPIRHPKLPGNAPEITQLLVQAVFAL